MLMPCTEIPGGGFICTRGVRRPKCSVPQCGRPVQFECDYPMPWPSSRMTCDAKLCGVHARVQPGKLGSDGSATCHYCPPHHDAAAVRLTAASGG